MRESCLTEYFKKIEELFSELNKIAPEDDSQFREIRNNLAGLLVVSLAATYENCVKTVLINYADIFHDKFSHQVERKYNYLNSKIKYEALREYLNHFDGDSSFFEEKVNDISNRLKNEIHKTYDQILVWRHAFAHANSVVTSINDAYKAHRYAKYVLYAFEDSLIGHVSRDAIKSTKFYANNAAHAAKAADRNNLLILNIASGHRNIEPILELSTQALSDAKLYAEQAKESVAKAMLGPITVTMEQITIAKKAAAQTLSACKITSSLKKQVLDFIKNIETNDQTL